MNTQKNPGVAPVNSDQLGTVEVQPILFGSVKELFGVADRRKTVGDYKAADIVFAFILDWLVGQSDLLENNDERESVRLEYETDHGAPHYDLCVMVYEAESEERESRLNIPAPLLKKQALCCFFRHGAQIVERMEHGREHEDGEPVDITSFGVTDPGWVLETEEEWEGLKKEWEGKPFPAT